MLCSNVKATAFDLLLARLRDDNPDVSIVIESYGESRCHYRTKTIVLSIQDCHYSPICLITTALHELGHIRTFYNKRHSLISWEIRAWKFAKQYAVSNNYPFDDAFGISSLSTYLDGYQKCCLMLRRIRREQKKTGKISEKMYRMFYEACVKDQLTSHNPVV